MNNIPANFAGIAKVGTNLYVGDGGDTVNSNINNCGMTACTNNSTALSTAANNLTLLQALVSQGGVVNITAPGIYALNNYITVSSNTTINISAGVILIRVVGGANCSIFRNATPTTGNENIKIQGEGVLFGNVDSYVASYDAQPAVCPNIPQLYSANIANCATGISLSNPNGNVIQLDNVKNVVVRGLQIIQGAKYQLYGSKISNFLFENLYFYGDDVTYNTLGRDMIHIQGNSYNGIVRNITGDNNDDCIVLNCRDVLGMVTPRSTGPIRNILIENIFTNSFRRLGSLVHLYAGLDVGTLDAPNTNGYDIAPTVTSVVQTAGVATVTTSTAHNMLIGDSFWLFGATTTGYNTGSARFGQTLALARVTGTPTANTFNYYVNNSIPSSATGTMPSLVRYYAMSGITVRNVKGKAIGGSGIDCSVTTDSTVYNYGVYDNLVIDTTTCSFYPGAAESSIVSMQYGRYVNAVVSNCYTTETYRCPLLQTPNEGYLSGTFTLNNPITLAPYKPYSSSGQAFININYRDNIVINGLNAIIYPGGGGWSNVITLSKTSSSLLQLNSPKLRSVEGSGVVLVKSPSSSNIGQIVINGGDFDSSSQIIDMGGTDTGTTITINNTNFPALSYAPFALYSSAGAAKINFNNCNFTSGSLVYASGPTVANTVKFNACAGTITTVLSGSTGVATTSTTATYA